VVRLGRRVLLELELEGELDGAGTAGLVQGVETAVGAAGAGLRLPWVGVGARVLGSGPYEALTQGC
jgi:hypothetical protein